MDIQSMIIHVLGKDFLDEIAKDVRQKNPTEEVGDEWMYTLDDLEFTLNKVVNRLNPATFRDKGRIGPSQTLFDADHKGRLLSLSPDQLRVLCSRLRGSGSARANTAVYAGKWAYECQLGTSGLMQIGWSTIKCKLLNEAGVGDTKHSYAYDGHRRKKWNRTATDYGEAWLAGDIIGSAIDVDAGTIEFYRNGRSMGVAFEGIQSGQGMAYVPAVSLSKGESLVANFGGRPWKYPIVGWKPLQQKPVKDALRVDKLLEWIDNALRLQEDMKEELGVTLSENKVTNKALLCLFVGFLFRALCPLLSKTYVIEVALLPFIKRVVFGDNFPIKDDKNLLDVTVENIPKRPLIKKSQSTAKSLSLVKAEINSKKSPSFKAGTKVKNLSMDSPSMTVVNRLKNSPARTVNNSKNSTVTAMNRSKNSPTSKTENNSKNFLAVKNISKNSPTLKVQDTFNNLRAMEAEKNAKNAPFMEDENGEKDITMLTAEHISKNFLALGAKNISQNSPTLKVQDDSKNSTAMEAEDNSNSSTMDSANNSRNSSSMKAEYPELTLLLDYLWMFLETEEMSKLLTSILELLDSNYRGTISDVNYSAQKDTLCLLHALVTHERTRKHLISRIFFTDVKILNFLNVKAMDEHLLTRLVPACWDHEDSGTEEDVREKYLAAVDGMYASITELEQMHVVLLKVLFTNTDDTPTQSSSRKLFVRELRDFLAKRNNTMLARKHSDIFDSTLCSDLFALLSLLQVLWAEELHSRPVLVSTQKICDDASRSINQPQLGGSFSRSVVVFPGWYSPSTSAMEDVTQEITYTESTDMMNVSDLLLISVIRRPTSQTNVPPTSDGGNPQTNPGVHQSSGNNPTLTTGQDMSLQTTTQSDIPTSAQSDMPTTVIASNFPPITGGTNPATSLARETTSPRVQYLGQVSPDRAASAQTQSAPQDHSSVNADRGSREQRNTSQFRFRAQPTSQYHEQWRRRYFGLDQHALQVDPLATIGGNLAARESLEEVLHFIILLYTSSVHEHLLRVAGIKTKMSKNIKCYLDHMTSDKKENALGEKVDEYFNVLRDNIEMDSRHIGWILSALYSPRKQAQLAFLLRALLATLNETSAMGVRFKRVPCSHVECVVMLTSLLRTHGEPLRQMENLADHVELLKQVAEFLAAHIPDERIEEKNISELLLRAVTDFFCDPLTVKCMESVRDESKAAFIRHLLKAYTKPNWAQANCLLVRIWHGSGFAFRYTRSPHLAEKGDPPDVHQSDGSSSLIYVYSEPCPSAVYQKEIQRFLLDEANGEAVASMLNGLLNQMNWAFSEFVTIVQTIQNQTTNSVTVNVQHLVITATCFELLVCLLRVLEMVVVLARELFTDPGRPNAANMLERVVQFLNQLLVRCTLGDGCFNFILNVDIRTPQLEVLDHFPVLAAVAGVLVALVDEEVKEEGAIPPVTRVMLSDSFPLWSLQVILKEDSEDTKKSKVTFSLEDYPNDVSQAELSSLRCVLRALQFHQSRLSTSSDLSDGDNKCSICFHYNNSARFEPCGHESCSSCINHHLLNTRLCFFCKTRIVKVVEQTTGTVLHDFSTNETPRTLL